MIACFQLCKRQAPLHGPVVIRQPVQIAVAKELSTPPRAHAVRPHESRVIILRIVTVTFDTGWDNDLYESNRKSGSWSTAWSRSHDGRLRDTRRRAAGRYTRGARATDRECSLQRRTKYILVAGAGASGPR